MTATNLKVRTPVPFPAQVVGAGGIKVSKKSGIWTIEPDFSALAAISGANVSDPTLKQIWLFDPISGEYNVLTLAGLGDALYVATSISSLTIGIGSNTFATQSGKGFAVGSWVYSSSDADPKNFMVGQVASYTNGSLVVNVSAYGGSGTHADWTLRASSPPGAGYKATSTTSLITAGSGSKAFATQNGLAYSAGARIRATSAGTGEWMEGVVTAYDGVTLTATMDLNSGTGTHADWNINLAGQRGTQGPAGVGDLVSTNNLSDVANAATAKSNLGVRGQGKETIWIPAAAMKQRTTNGATPGNVEQTTNKNMVTSLDFDTTTQQFAQFSVWMPKSWNLGPVTFQPCFSQLTTAAGGVVFGLAGVAVSDGDSLDVAFGTAQTSTKTAGTANVEYQGPESSGITIAGTPAAGDRVMFQVNRTVADAGDTLAQNARLHGIRLFFNTNAVTDA